MLDRPSRGKSSRLRPLRATIRTQWNDGRPQPVVVNTHEFWIVPRPASRDRQAENAMKELLGKPRAGRHPTNLRRWPSSCTGGEKLPFEIILELRVERELQDQTQQPHFAAIRLGKNERRPLSKVTTMLAEKFFLILETLRSNGPSDMIIVSAAPHIPVKLPRPHPYLLFGSRGFIRRAEGTASFLPI
jgi:hypothetical protein